MIGATGDLIPKPEPETTTLFVSEIVPPMEAMRGPNAGAVVVATGVDCADILLAAS